MYEGPSPLPDGISLSLATNTSGEGPTHLKATVKGQNMAYWDTHIGKLSIYRENHTFTQFWFLLILPLPNIFHIKSMCTYRH